MKSWIGRALILFGTFGSGGLAGAIYSHYANRLEPTIIAPSISTITIANPQSAGSLIPDLKVQVGNEVIGSLYAVTVTFDVVSGPYVDGTDVAITFPSAPHIYGKPVASAPSPPHSIACTPIENGLRCRMSPLKVNSGGPFRVSIATDKPDQPKVNVVAKDVQLATVGEITAQKSRFSQYVPFWVALAVALTGFMVTFVLSFTIRKFQDAAQSAAVVSRLRSNKGYLVIIAANYGCGDHRIDVTKQLNDAVVDDKLHVFAGNQLAGDPCPNVSKDLWVSWQYKDQKFNRTVTEGETLDLP